MPSPSRPPSKPSALSHEQGDQVLRYWLAALRLEEALSVRPQARRGALAALVPKLERPTAGQDYFKLPLDAGLAELLAKQAQLKRALGR